MEHMPSTAKLITNKCEILRIPKQEFFLPLVYVELYKYSMLLI